LEIVVTVALFLLNAMAICVFALVWLCYCVGCDFKKLCCCRKVKQMRLVTDEALIEQVRQKLIAGGDDNGDGDDEAAPELYWRHPVSSLAQTIAPEEVLSHTGITKGWVWTDENGQDSWSKSTPEVVTEIPDGEKANPGEFICTLDLKTMELSPLEMVLPDVMSDPCDGDSKNAEQPPHGQNEMLPTVQEEVVVKDNEPDFAPQTHDNQFAGHNPMQQNDSRVVVLDDEIQLQRREVQQSLRKEALQNRRKKRQEMRRSHPRCVFS
jgi:hypothetical protein